MTNGEKFKEIFQISHVDEGELYAYAWLPNHDAAEISIDWWNAEYKEPPTKNDSPKYCDRNICLKNEYNNVGCEDCEVTKSQESTTKNNLGVELISKEQTIDRVLTYFNHIDKGNDDEWAKGYETGEEDAIAVIESMPPVTPQEPRSFKWCTDCKEYDQEKHCCHRYSKVIRDSVAEIEQEPILDKIRAEINTMPCAITSMREIYINRDKVINIIDKYKAESKG